jgi:hypothetical protein
LLSPIGIGFLARVEPGVHPDDLDLDAGIDALCADRRGVDARDDFGEGRFWTKLVTPLPVIEPVSDARVGTKFFDAEATRRNRLIYWNFSSR